jgi:hypothetical protein
LLKVFSPLQRMLINLLKLLCMNQFRPTSLCNVSCKIVTKVWLAD